MRLLRAYCGQPFFLHVLFGGVVHQHVEAAKFFHDFLHGSLAELLIADVACNQQASCSCRFNLGRNPFRKLRYPLEHCSSHSPGPPVAGHLFCPNLKEISLMDEQQPLTHDAIHYVDDRPPQLELTAKDRPNDLTATKGLDRGAIASMSVGGTMLPGTI